MLLLQMNEPDQLKCKVMTYNKKSNQITRQFCRAGTNRIKGSIQVEATLASKVDQLYIDFEEIKKLY